jgi:hypothetical protein
MPLALELGLDADAEREVLALWDALERAEVPSLATHAFPLRPHVTLVVSDDLTGLRRARAALRPLIEPQPVELVGPAFFPTEPPILHLAVGATQELLAMHRAAVEALQAAEVQMWPHYQIAFWVPHCTLSMGVPLDRLDDALIASLARPLPIRTVLHDARLTDTETGETETL